MTRELVSAVAMLVLAAACTSSMTVSAPPATAPPRTPTVRLLVSSGCPEQIALDKDVENPPKVLGQTLLPSAEPTGALWCTYGRADAGGGLQTERRLTVEEAASLARIVNRLDLHVPNPNAPRNCPIDLGTADILVFSYYGNPTSTSGGTRAAARASTTASEQRSRAATRASGVSWTQCNGCVPHTPDALGD